MVDIVIWKFVKLWYFSNEIAGEDKRKQIGSG